MKRTLWGPANIATAIGYRLMRKAPTEDRCAMGSPVHPWLHCPRPVIDPPNITSLFCRVHERTR